MFVVDWQAPVLSPIGRVQANDLDEHPKLHFALGPDGEGQQSVFGINSTTGVVQLVKSLATDQSDQFRMTVAVSDGQHTVTAPLLVCPLWNH